jgi:uncharacterized membrane protein
MSQREVEQPVARGKGRLEAIDLARGFALLAMAIYHFAWDLEFFGYVEPGTTQVGGWRFFARSIATSFLFLVGVSLVLAHAKGVNWKPFAKRIAMVAGAAGAITLATWIAVPDAFIFFGILHHIALASVLGLAFLRMPLALVLIAAALFFAAPHFLRMPFFDHPALWWLGLAPQNPRSNDYVPMAPFFAAVLMGIATARIASSAGLFDRLRSWSPGRWSRPLQLAGRHSLLVYLVHQPILIAGIWLYAQILPPAEVDPVVSFIGACSRECEAAGRSDAFCGVYCVCVTDDLEREGVFAEVAAGRSSAATDATLRMVVEQCSLEAAPMDAREGSGQ